MTIGTFKCCCEEFYSALTQYLLMIPGVVAPYNAGITRMLYHRNFTIPKTWEDLNTRDRIVLHIDKVDWEAEVWVNGINVGQHRGGYLHLSSPNCIDSRDSLGTTNLLPLM